MFTKEVSRFLTNYSKNPVQVDRLIVSAFLYSNNILSIENKQINTLLIRESEPDHSSLLEFLKIGQIEKIEDLIEFFEFVISPDDKIVTGAIYTPEVIRKYIINEVFQSIELVDDLRICDPACGCAGFLYTVAKKIKELSDFSYEHIYANFIYGLDIQEYSVNRSKVLLSLVAILEGEDKPEFRFNIFCGNALSFEWSEDDRFEFHAVVGNPPYVASRNIDPISKEYLQNWAVCSSGHPDLYIPFFEIGMLWLVEGGVLGFITMNTFFKSINGRSLRSFFDHHKYKINISDFGGIQIFQSKSTYTCVCMIDKKKSDGILYRKLKSIKDLQEGRIPFKTINYTRLDSQEGWNLQELEILTKIENTGNALSKMYKSRNGIATLKNSIYIYDPIDEDDEFYYLKYLDKEIFKIEKNLCKEIINPNKLIKIDSVDSIKRKIIFPYYYEEDKPKIIEENNLKDVYPFAYQYLLARKGELAERDKGGGAKYDYWYGYGRNQSLERFEFKLFFPHIANETPNFVINIDEDLLFCNGIAIIGRNLRELLFLRKLLLSRLFWFYITNSSRHYGSEYFSLSKNYFKNFGIYDFTEDEIDYIIEESDGTSLDRFFEMKYDINLDAQ